MLLGRPCSHHLHPLNMAALTRTRLPFLSVTQDLEAWKIVAKELAGAFTRIHEQLEDLGGERGGKRKRDKGDATGDKRKKREVGGPPALKKRPAGTSCRFPLRWLAARR